MRDFLSITLAILLMIVIFWLSYTNRIVLYTSYKGVSDARKQPTESTESNH
jgi:hypothetical protein